MGVLPISHFLGTDDPSTATRKVHTIKLFRIEWRNQWNWSSASEGTGLTAGISAMNYQQRPRMRGYFHVDHPILNLSRCLSLMMLIRKREKAAAIIMGGIKDSCEMKWRMRFLCTANGDWQEPRGLLVFPVVWPQVYRSMAIFRVTSYLPTGKKHIANKKGCRSQLSLTYKITAKGG